MRVMELLKNACLGWQNYLSAEKLIFFFFLILLIFWLRNKWDDYRLILTYSLCASALCIFPPTAVGLMLYQTKYYDYQWILAFIPINIVIALGGTLILCQIKANKKLKAVEKWGIFVVLLAILLLSGNKLEKDGKVRDTKMEKERTLEVLREIPVNQAVLWAPDTILEYSRELRPDIKLLYGRDMFEKDVEGFSFDKYEENTIACHDWMVWAQVYYDISGFPVDDIVWFDWIVEKGVNTVILPANLKESTRKRIERHYHTESKKVGDYYLLTI